MSAGSQRALTERELSLIADIFMSVDLKINNQLLRREIGGKSLYDRIRAGESVEEAGRLIASVARREADQRDALNKRLNSRPRLTISLEDVGAPHLSEMD